MHSVTGRFGGWVPVPFNGLDVKEDWFVVGRIPELFQNRNQVVEIVAVNGANIVESQFLKECTTGNETTGVFINTLVNALHIFRQKFVERFCKVTEILKGFGHQQIGCVGGKLRSRDGSASTGCSGGKTDLTIVIQYDNHSGLQISRTIHGFVGHSSGNGTISNDSHAIVLSFVQDAFGNTHSLRSRNGRRGMAGAERIVFTFFSFAKSGDTIQLTEGGESVPSSGQNLVGVTLMGHIPNNIVVRHVEYIV
mmetsp:Transcript_20625/g.44893  ORF Transcript_20625/g.44893 Transcript_20625/m.44893 type:complete len:251 (+) Transcript_20625:1572-2324(+)